MFAALIREGEVVRLPSGKEALVLGQFAGAVKVQDENGEELEISPRHLRTIPGRPQPLIGSHILDLPEAPDGETPPTA